MKYTPSHKASEYHTLDIDSSDARVSVSFTNRRIKSGGGIRGEITEFSRQSRNRLLWAARNTEDLASILTVTYPHEDYATTATGGDYMRDGRVVKEHLRKFRQVLLYWKIRGFWFLEFQKRGAPHIHFFIVGTISPRTEAKLKATWSRMVGTHCPHHPTRGLDVQVLRKKHAAASYAAKYSSKDEQKKVPEQYRGVGRFWGFFGDMKKPVIHRLVSLKEIYQLARVAKNYAKARARADGYTIRSRYGSGIQGFAVYYCAPILKAYLSHRYTAPDNPPGTVLRLHTRQNLAFDSLIPVHIEATHDTRAEF
jgi:hypothetical protein